jgi:hypothetical protein
LIRACVPRWLGHRRGSGRHFIPPLELQLLSSLRSEHRLLRAFVRASVSLLAAIGREHGGHPAPADIIDVVFAPLLPSPA